MCNQCSMKIGHSYATFFLNPPWPILQLWHYTSSQRFRTRFSPLQPSVQVSALPLHFQCNGQLWTLWPKTIYFGKCNVCLTGHNWAFPLCLLASDTQAADCSMREYQLLTEVKNEVLSSWNQYYNTLDDANNNIMYNPMYRQIFGSPMISMFLRTEDGAKRAQPILGNVFYYTTIKQISRSIRSLDGNQIPSLGCFKMHAKNCMTFFCRKKLSFELSLLFWHPKKSQISFLDAKKRRKAPNSAFLAAKKIMQWIIKIAKI